MVMMRMMGVLNDPAAVVTIVVKASDSQLSHLNTSAQ